jgi:4-amino-4-deoxy-L-arabinose transferase-like glycosyltransferase
MTPALDRWARDRRVWAALIGLALLVRLAFVALAPPTILWKDPCDYESTGWRLVTEHRFTTGPWLAPGYPWFIAAVYAITGHHLIALRTVEALLSTLTVALIGAFGGALFSPGAGLMAAALATAHPILAALPATQYSETVAIFLLVPAFGLFALALRQPRAAWFLLSGLCTGLALACKPTIAAALPGLALGATLRFRSEGVARIAGRAALFLVGVACVVAPWFVRNDAVYGRWFFVVKAGSQFWLGNNADFHGETFRFPRGSDALRDSLQAQPDPFVHDRLYYREGIRFVVEQPGQAAYLYVLRLRNLLALYPSTVTHTRYSVPLAAWAQAASSLAIYVGAVLGLTRMVALGYSALPLGVLTYLLGTSVFWTIMRYRLGIEVLLLWIAGLGWWWWLAGRRRSASHPSGMDHG